MAPLGLRSLGKLARVAVKEASDAVALQQRRAMSGEAKYSPKIFNKETPVDRGTMYVAKNPYVEALYWRRDHFEREFAWTGRNTFEITYFFGGIIAAMYGLSLFCMRHSDERSGYPQRSVLFAETEKGFVLPDERDFY